MNMVILDACRDNPFSRSFRSAGRGLAIINTAPVGTFISYSTGPGQIAQDGDGRNSPFTAALLETIKVPGLPVEQVFKRVRQKLDTASGGKQVPWELSSIKGDFYFHPAAKPASVEAVEPSSVSLWKQAQFAYDAGNFAEPEGENAIELARQTLHDNSGNSAAKDLITKAASAYENQAKLALSREDRNSALRIYRRLFKLFPERENYLKEIVALEKPAMPDITGTWNWSVRSPFVPDRMNIIKSDGTCNLNNMTGRWVYKKDAENNFIFYWSNNWTHSMTLSKDELMMTGTDDWGTRVTGRKIK